MNWPLAIARNRTALLAVVAAIVALLGGRDAGPIARGLRNAALALLRPAESAARRLIVMAARGLVVAPRSAPDFAGVPRSDPKGISRLSAFRLFDRRKRFVLRLKAPVPVGVPRIRVFWNGPFSAPAAPLPPAASRPEPAALVDPHPLRLRLGALERALADLPRQARRLARWRARERTAQAVRPGVRMPQPLRPGHPPGWRAGPGRDVDRVLRECHALALDALALDTS
jgi:hypothetical protein